MIRLRSSINLLGFELKSNKRVESADSLSLIKLQILIELFPFESIVIVSGKLVNTGNVFGMVIFIVTEVES